MRVWGGVREARGWCSVLGVPVPLLTLRYVPLAVPASLDEAILLTVSPKWPHQNLPMGGACGEGGEVGGRLLQVGGAGLEAVLDIPAVLSLRGWGSKGADRD